MKSPQSHQEKQQTNILSSKPKEEVKDKIKTVEKTAVGDSSTTRSSLLKKDAQSAQSAAAKYHSNNSLLKPSTKVKEKKEEPAAEEQFCFPPFNFDGSQALKSKLVLNLRNCQYDLFRTIAIEELGWKVVNWNNQVLEQNPNMANQEKQDQQTMKENYLMNLQQENMAAEVREQQQQQDNLNQQNQENGGENEGTRDENSSTQDASKTPETNVEAPNLQQQQQQQPEKYRINNDWNPNNWDIFWADSGMSPEFLSSLSNTQKVNHFLGMYNICRKSTLGMHLKRFQKEFPDHFDFFPKTWMYPAEFHDIQEYAKQKESKRQKKIESGIMTEAESEADPTVVFICKPECGSQGRGIFIHQKVEELRLSLNRESDKSKKEMNSYLKIEQSIETQQMNSFPSTQAQKDALNARMVDRPQNQYIVQKYVKRPALLYGHKYDFRIYVFITSVISPMTIFIYNDGLVRLATQKYDSTQDYENAYIHLTNYSLNKDNKDFDEKKHKLRVKDILKGELTSVSGNGKTYKKHASVIWSEIEQMVVKTMYTIQPQLSHLYRTSQAKEPDLCCDLLGFDVMLDHKLKPWMLEVNHMPSFRADTDIDYDIKHDLILNTLRILQLGTEQRRQQEVILKQEQKLAMQYGSVKRMTAQEHCLRVRFDHTLVEQYVPNNKYKRIYPLDPGRGGTAANGDDLEEVYAKLDKSASIMWRKQVGTITKKEKDQHNNPEKIKKKKGKNKKHLLTSMTSHIIDKTKEQEEDDENDQEEDPEDGYMELEEIKEQNGERLNSRQSIKGRRESTNSVIGDAMNGDRRDPNMQPPGFVNHILLNKNRVSNLNQKIHGNQYAGALGNQISQSSLSKASSVKAANGHGVYYPGQKNNQFQAFVPVNEFQLNCLNFTNGNAQGPGSGAPLGMDGRMNNNRAPLFYQNGKAMGQRQPTMEELKQMKGQTPVPSLNEILAQLHQDPGFRQRYKDYCRAVLDGRFSFGGIKNPIFEQIYGSQGKQAELLAQPQGFQVIGKQSEGPPVPGQPQPITLLKQQQQAQANYYQMTKTRQPKHLDTISHVQQQPPPPSQGPTISEAAYFIQRVNRILQTQGTQAEQQQQQQQQLQAYASGKAQMPPPQIQQPDNAPRQRVYPYTTGTNTASHTQMQHYQKGSPYQGGQQIQQVGQPSAGHTQTNSFSQQRSNKAEPNLRSSLYQRAERYSTGQNHGPVKQSSFNTKASNFRDREYREYQDESNQNHRSIPLNTAHHIKSQLKNQNALIQGGTQSATHAGAPNALAGPNSANGGPLSFQQNQLISNLAQNRDYNKQFGSNITGNKQFTERTSGLKATEPKSVIVRQTRPMNTQNTGNTNNGVTRQQMFAQQQATELASQALNKQQANALNNPNVYRAKATKMIGAIANAKDR